MLKKIITAVIIPAAMIILWKVYLYSWKGVIVIADGKRISLHSKPVSIENLLKTLNINVGKNDIVQPPLSSVVPGRGIIRIIRVERKIVKTEEELPFKVMSETSSETNLRPVTVQKGIMTRVFRDLNVVYHDGVEKTSAVKKQKIVKKYITRLLLFDKSGNIEKIYDLSKAKKIKMIATAYYPGDPLAWKDGTITCLGEKMERGIIAVDPDVIPLRTRLYVPGFGYGFAGDTGSAIKGNRVDLGVNNKEEEKPWMHKRVKVYILEQAKTW